MLVSNHVSYVDAAIIATCCPRARPLRDGSSHLRETGPGVGSSALSRAIPIASAKENAALKERAFVDIAAALAEGELVCIFPEGRLSPTGETAILPAGYRAHRRRDSGARGPHCARRSLGKRLQPLQAIADHVVDAAHPPSRARHLRRARRAASSELLLLLEEARAGARRGGVKWTI